MPELILLWLFLKHIAYKLESTGRKSRYYLIMAVVLWFGGELVGLCFAFFIVEGLNIANDELELLIIWVFMFFGGFFGAAITFFLIKYICSKENTMVSSALLCT